MKRRYLVAVAALGLMWSACNSNNSDKASGGTIVTDSPMLDSAVSDSLSIKAAPMDSPAVGTDNIKMDSMNNNPRP